MLTVYCECNIYVCWRDEITDILLCNNQIRLKTKFFLKSCSYPDNNINTHAQLFPTSRRNQINFLIWKMLTTGLPESFLAKIKFMITNLLWIIFSRTCNIISDTSVYKMGEQDNIRKYRLIFILSCLLKLIKFLLVWISIQSLTLYLLTSNLPIDLTFFLLLIALYITIISLFSHF